MGKIADIIKESDYRLSLFSDEYIAELEKNFDKNKPYIECFIRNKRISLKPEEIVRQLYMMKLVRDYKYPKDIIKVEHTIHFGREKKRADIVVMEKGDLSREYIVIEVKKPKLQEGKEQLRSYTNATGAPIAVWTNGEEESCYHRKDPNYFENIRVLPKADQTLEDILEGKFTLVSLVLEDRIINERKSLQNIILEMEDEVLANAGVDVFEEVFKLIFIKLYDEIESAIDYVIMSGYLDKKLKGKDRNNYEKIKECLFNCDDTEFRNLKFNNTGQTDSELKKKIQELFDRAKEKWEGIFDETTQIQLTPSHLSICVASLQKIKLFNSNLQVIDEAFEYLVNKSAKGEKGQYFTPRHVIDMCVKMLNPKAGEYMIDTAAGSCGFPVHTIFHIVGSLFKNTGIPEGKKKYIEKIFGIDFDRRVVRVARMLNLIAGDGSTNVLHLNNLDYEQWDEVTEEREWHDIYRKGFGRLEKLKVDKKSYKQFNFDVVMANPPFAGDIKEARIIHQYELGMKENNRPKSKVGRDILFIERNLNFLKPGGRMALVLPQGRFNNTNDKEIREYIARKARILAVVGLHVNTFKPHTGTKTSILFLQKWDGEPKKDYEIFFAVSENSGKDNSGDYIYVADKDGRPKLDKSGHLLIDHDLHSHNGELKDGIAEAFINWAIKENLSFYRE